MPAMMNTPKSPEPNANPNQESGGTRSVSRYEQCREERIKENLQRMQTLGIFDLSLKLKSETRPAKRHSANCNSGRRSIRDTPPIQSSGPKRRSSRLQNVTPVSYSEAVEAKRGKGSRIVQLEEGARPEIYTEEHEKLLGDTERSWTFFVDGYGKDGKRIYDPINGKTCHQCRQKTLGHRTQCSHCNMVQGQFCGDCLYMRYGEHVLEALDNPDWICPVCRGICNCSLCRTQKGWLPTGTIYRRISKLGYKSVAHYLIQTKRTSTDSDKETDSTPNQTSAKRSLSFKETEESLALEHPHLMNTDDHNAPHVDDKTDGEPLISARRSSSFNPSDNKQVKVQCDLKPLETLSMEKNSGGKANELSGGGSERMKKRKVAVEVNTDSIAGRLRQRRKSLNGENSDL